MSQKYEKLKTLLRELFQLDQPDLDFGLYRIMHAKSGEVTQFLDKDLLPQVKAELAKLESAEVAEAKKALADRIELRKKLGDDPDKDVEVERLKEKVNQGGDSPEDVEGEVYDHLHRFFRRYYSEGDFLSKRVYKPGAYAIPYEGEEVMLHWANKDQYYIKTSEYLRDYAFRLRPENERNPMRVHFRLVDATEGEHGNVKATEGKERRFRLADSDAVSLESGELVVRFTYQPNKAKQKELNAAAEATIVAITDSALVEWIAALAKLAPTDKDPSRTVLAKQLEGYSDRNTFDYFIHKDLGAFLRRELDFYIKNEVMHLDDVESETAPKVEQYLSKIKVIRRTAGKVIDFLAQLEDFQKKLWLKKKFVVEASYCITLGAIPETLHSEIAANAAQTEEWVKLLAVDEIQGDLVRPGYSNPLGREFLKAQPTLVVDTRHFSAAFTEGLLDTVGHLDEQTDGVLFHSENFQALSMMHTQYRGKVKVTYVDPPYNTGDDGFPYKDTYQHSSWLAMMRDRLQLGRRLQTQDGTITVSIDDTELDHLTFLLRETYGDVQLAKLVWDRNRKNDAKFFSVGHEYMVVYSRDRERLRGSGVTFREPKDGIEEARAYFAELRSRHNDDWEAIRLGWRQWFDNISVADPRRRLMRYSEVGSRGPYRDDRDISWPGGGGPRYEVLHPATRKPCRIPSRGWVFPTAERFWEAHGEGRIMFGTDDRTIPSLAAFLFESDGQVMPSVFYSYAQTASQEFDALWGSRVFDNPKNWRDLFRVMRYLGDRDSIVLDYFAGSGTTGHAVINLNREDGGQRRFMLVETGDYFDSILLPRLKKVTFSPEWKDGKPKRMATAEEAQRSPRIVKTLRLESYEDALNNLETRRTDTQSTLLDAPEARGADGLKEQYLLKYMLDVETRGSQSLLNIKAFTDPTAYKLKVKRPGSDESREVNVDLLETFNYLIGLTVHAIAAPQTFTAAFERDGEKRLRLKAGRLKATPEGTYWFRTVTGTTPDGRKTLMIWRKRPGGDSAEGVEQDNLVLDEWFVKQGYSTKDSEFQLIYVNGDNNLENLKTPEDTWKVRLIEEDFHRLMFDTEGA